MLSAMADWEAVAAVNFVLRAGHPNFIHIQNSTGNNSYVGMQGGSQVVNIFNWNYEFIMAHELGHALGLWHEQSRTDRDAYIQINTANICQTCCNGGPCNFAFNVVPTSAENGPYDFDSVMHYGQCAFSTCAACPSASCGVDNGRTITVLPPNAATWQGAIGQRTHLSDGDKDTMAFLYPPSSSPTTGACCVFAPCGCVADQSIFACAAAGGVYQGNGSMCVNDICGCLMRACCNPAGTCIGDQTRATCEAAGNTWHIEASCTGAESLPSPRCNVYNINNCSWDNGLPLNDGGAARAHTHAGGDGQLPRYDFLAADDFILRGPDSTPCNISMVKWYFRARPSDAEPPVFPPPFPPADFVGLNVAVMRNFIGPHGLDSPGGHGSIPYDADDLNPKVKDMPGGIVYARTFLNADGDIAYADLNIPIGTY